MQGSSLQVEILSVCLSVCLYVITSYYFPYSDSKLTQPPPVDLSHATSPTVSNVPHLCLPCPPVNWTPFPVNWSTNEHFHLGLSYMSTWHFLKHQSVHIFLFTLLQRATWDSPSWGQFPFHKVKYTIIHPLARADGLLPLSHSLSLSLLRMLSKLPKTH